MKCAANHKNEATDAAMNISLEASGKKGKLAGYVRLEIISYARTNHQI